MPLETFNKLEAFKEYMYSEFRDTCVSRFSEEVYTKYIQQYVDDMMENIEYHCEDLAEESIQHVEDVPDEEDVDPIENIDAPSTEQEE